MRRLADHAPGLRTCSKRHPAVICTVIRVLVVFWYDIEKDKTHRDGRPSARRGGSASCGGWASGIGQWLGEHCARGQDPARPQARPPGCSGGGLRGGVRRNHRGGDHPSATSRSRERTRCPWPTSSRDTNDEVGVTLVLDSGAFVALERNERQMWIRLKAAQVSGEVPITHAGVLGQVWRQRAASSSPGPGARGHRGHRTR